VVTFVKSHDAEVWPKVRAWLLSHSFLPCFYALFSSRHDGTEATFLSLCLGFFFFLIFTSILVSVLLYVLQ
jgi:hypothetical protein